MIHVLNYSGQIIDFFSQDDSSIIKAMYSRTSESETLELIVLSGRGSNFKERNRILIQDKNENYREFIVDHVEDGGQYIEVECTASYLVDISSSKPIPAGKYEKMTVNQKLSETLRDSGWTVGDCDYAGIKTNSWTSVRTPLEMISQLETAHDVVADYEIIIDGYEVVKRLVNMRKPTPLFKGKEIEYGKDLVNMKRTVDFSEVKTALFAFGPENENGERISLVVYDDVAQEQLGLPQRYIWGVYEPETEDNDMTQKRLETLAKTELNKHKTAAISYEVSTIDLEKEYAHEIIRFGDIVRIKNSDFTPSIYAESEVIAFDHDLISGDCTYQFGKAVEFKESDLRRYFESKLGYIQQKLNDNLTNVNTIVRDSLDSELQYFERKIFKGETAPDNPVNDTMWLDTSNPNVAVLRRYFNGEWHNATAEKASDVGAVTREQALHSELTNAFTNLSIQHAKLLKEVLGVLNSEFFVSTTLKANVQNNLDATINVYNNIKSNLDSMTSETATIGKLIDTQSLFLEYREKLQALYTSVETAKRAINARFKLLQSQYTDAKFNDAMSKVASAIPGGKWDAANQVLTSEVPNETRINEIVATITESAVESLHNSVNEVGERLNTVNGDLIERINNERVNIRQYVDTVNLNLRDEVTNKFKLTKNELSNSINAVKEDVINNVADPLKIRMTTAESGLQQLQDSLLLSATKTEVNRLLTDELTPLKTDVNNQKAQLKVMSDSIDSKVSKSDYTTDKNGIVQRLNAADSAREQLANQISDRVTLNEFKSAEFGGRNLLVGTEDWSGFRHGSDVTIFDFNTRLAKMKNDNYERRWISQEVRVEPNTDYTISFYAYKNGSKDTGIHTAVRALPSVGKDFEPFKNIFLKDTQINDELKRYFMTFRVEEYSWIRVYFSSTNDKNSSIPFVGKAQLEKGKWISDYKPAEEDTELKFNKMETQITQNGKEISARATSEEFNASRKTLSRVLADFAINTTTGLSLIFDENGTIQSHTVGPNGIKIDTTKFVINDGDVIVQNGRTTIKDAYIDKLFSKQATINYLKVMDVDLNRATVSGSKNGESTILSGGKIRSTGSFNRTFPQGNVTYEAYTESWNGVYRSGLISKTFGSKKLTDITRWLSLTDKGITTQREIHSMSPNKNGARFIDFFADETYGSDVSGQGMHIYSGQALTIESEYAFYLSAKNYYYIRTQESGIEINQNGGNLVLKRTSPFTSTNYTGGSYMSIKSSDDVEQGHVGILSNNRHISVCSAFGEVLLKGNKVFALDGNGENRVPIHAKFFEGEKLIGSIEAPDTNIYAMCQGELRVTDKNGYNGGNVNYKNIRFNSWNAMSHEKFKYDIVEWNYSVLDIFREDLQLHAYKVKSEAGTEYNQIHHGIILRENSNLDRFPVEWRNADGFDGNEVLWWNTKAIQELAHENTELKNQISEMKNKIDRILEMIK